MAYRGVAANFVSFFSFGPARLTVRSFRLLLLFVVASSSIRALFWWLEVRLFAYLFRQIRR